MLIIERRKKHGINFREIWYATESCNLPGINLYRGAETVIGKEMTRMRTLITDLTLPEEEIQSSFNKNTRYAIRRSPRDGVSVSFKTARDERPSEEAIEDEDIRDFARFYESFLCSKNIESEGFDKYYNEIKTYVDNKAFAITKAHDGDGALIAAHTYILGEDFVRSYHSASLFRDNKESYAITGRANRYLHFEDMRFFKAMGIRIYDWGGAGLTEDVRSITEFKEEFGGKEHFYYDCEEVSGAKAAAVKGIINLIS